MRILLTGASGYFGSGIVKRLSAAGHHVIACSRSLPVTGSSHTIDIANERSTREAFHANLPINVVVHAAALAHVNPSRTMADLCCRVNVDGTANVVRTAQSYGVNRFVFISSTTVYGDYDLPDRVTEDVTPAPGSIYGRAKLAGEELVLDSGMDAYILRISTMYSDNWLFNVRKRVRLPVPGLNLYFRLDPYQKRYSLCSRDNGADAVVWCVENRIPPGVYNVSDGYEYSQDEILAAVAAREGVRTSARIPLGMVRALEVLVRRTVPFAGVRERMRSRYWKFCEKNIYPSDKLMAAGFRAEPHLLSIAGLQPMRRT